MATTTYKYPLDVEARTYLDITAYNYRNPTVDERNSTGIQENPVDAKRDTNPLFNIKIYIPGGFGESITSEWSNEQIGFLGSTKNLNLSAGSLGKFAVDSVKGLASQFMMTKGTEMLMGSMGIVGSALTSMKTTGEAALGRKIAPNEAKIFTGTSGRSLPLNFTLSPRNSEEGAQIINIISSLRNSSVAQLEDVGEAVGELLNTTTGEGASGIIFTYKYPPLFDIRVIRGNTAATIRSGTFHEYRTMALGSFSVAYSDNTDVYSNYHDGVPSLIKLDLTFESIYPTVRTGNISY